MKKKKNREAQLSIELALDLIEKLGITEEEYAVNFCNLSSVRQFYNYKKRGTIASNRYYASINALREFFFRDYCEKMKLLQTEYEE